MLGEINSRYMEKKNTEKADRFIMEAVLDVEEVLPGSEDEMDDVVDVDSIPDDVYKKIDAELEKIVNDPNFNDDDIEELVDDDVDENDVDDDAIEAIIDEACSAWYDDEGIGHPNTTKRDGGIHQPLYRPTGSVLQTTMSESSEKEVCSECGKPLNDCTCGEKKTKDDKKQNECNESVSISALRNLARG